MMLLLPVLLLCSVTTKASADDALKHRITVFAGRFTTKSMAETLDIVSVDYENNSLAAAAYGQDLVDLGHGWLLGPEIGLASRFGASRSLEIWSGAAIRHRGASLGRVRISPALTFGLSWVDKPIGIERTRQITQGGNAQLLYYLGPEVGFSLSASSQWQLVYRLHHRSGGFRTMGNLKGGHNANTVGLCYRF